ncbi:DUF262 domain-containing protein [Elizabethkingia miricola]|uniref:DUF262 domain-containing protein n=1 Tax=Elizabethkingia miricola TaxID=172045 RepID=UPI00099ADB76|nr:DUF262 domain-containing protein [Elizabethkingia miricola]OPC08690.1 hypothetical protein BAY01_14800 [Elizabethkingia miricola]
MKSALKIDTRVRSLRSYLEEFEKGAFQVPSFQRDFLWETEDIKQLFDSIKNRYPIGSIQFWQPVQDGEVWLDENAKIGPYIITKPSREPKPIFILDGLQRLSSLFGCLINPEKYNKERLMFDEKTYSDKFRIFYDLEEESFEFIQRNRKPKHYQVPLYILISTSDFRKFARENLEKIEDETKIELYLDRADEISKIITEYEIASVDINSATVEEAVEIFWRVNKKGIVISKDWIVNALTNDGHFKLKDEMDTLIGKLRHYNFQEVNRDLLFNCIQSSFGKLSFDVDVVSLIKEDRKGFIQITKNTMISIEKAVKFLFEELHVLHPKLLPSNWQLIFIVEFFNILENPSNELLAELKNWFWITIYSNYFTLVASNPSKRQKAFIQFKNYFNGSEVKLLYNEDPNIKLISPKYKFTNFGSVRFCANVLFQIKDYIIDTENCVGFESIKLFKSQKETLENIIYIPIQEKNKDNIKFLKSEDLSFMLNKENNGKYHKFFITDEMREIYLQGNVKEVLKLRLKTILEKEQKFIEQFGMEYEE